MQHVMHILAFGGHVYPCQAAPQCVRGLTCFHGRAGSWTKVLLGIFCSEHNKFRAMFGNYLAHFCEKVWFIIGLKAQRNYSHQFWSNNILVLSGGGPKPNMLRIYVFLPGEPFCMDSNILKHSKDHQKWKPWTHFWRTSVNTFAIYNLFRLERLWPNVLKVRKFKFWKCIHLITWKFETCKWPTENPNPITFELW